MCTAVGKMSGEHYIPSGVSAYRPVAEISASVQNPGFFRPSNLKL